MFVIVCLSQHGSFVPLNLFDGVSFSYIIVDLRCVHMVRHTDIQYLRGKQVRCPISQAWHDPTLLFLHLLGNKFLDLLPGHYAMGMSHCHQSAYCGGGHR